MTKMKDIAKAYFEKTVTNAIITVLAYFNDSQCQFTKDAETTDGLNILTIVNSQLLLLLLTA